MKDKIILVVIGGLVGVVVATGSFFIYSKVAKPNPNSHQQIGMPGGNQQGMLNGPSGQNWQSGQNGPINKNNQLQQMPNNNNAQNNR